MTSSEIYIQATDTDPTVQAQAEILRIQARLLGTPGNVRADELLSYLAAADEALYAPAAGAPATRLLIRALRISSTALAQCSDALSSTEVGAAQTVEILLAAHLAVEGTVLLPALADLPGADLSALRSDLQTLLDGGRLEHPAVIDVTEMPHGQRHPRIFARYARLAPGQDFVLMNNHDPKPLRREFEATYPGDFTWDYLESGPERWQVRIGRTAVDA